MKRSSMRLLTFLITGIVLFACAHTYREELVKPSSPLEAPRCIAILPFENLSGFPEAGRIVADFVATEIYATNRFCLMERMEAERILQEAGILLSSRLPTKKEAKDIANALGVEGLIMGTVSDFSYGSTLAEMRVARPSVSVTAKLIRASDGEVIWAEAVDQVAGGVINPRKASLSQIALRVAKTIAKSLEKAFTPTSMELTRPCWEGKTILARKPERKKKARPTRAAITRGPKEKPRIAVFNASGVEKLEEDVGVLLLMKNWDVATLTTYPHGRTMERSTIYYRPGYEREARNIEKEIPGPQKLEQSERMEPRVHITIIVGRDLIGYLR